MEYAVYEKGRQIGSLKLSSEGLYTSFETTLPPKQGLFRLWLIGEDRNYCLGLLEPKRGERTFSCRLSREATRKLPKDIKYALCTDSKAVFKLRRPQNTQRTQNTESRQNSSLNWQAASMGCYTARDNLSCLVAIPTTIKQDERLRLVTIKGNTYMVFRY